jgi:hypothetical protein
MMLVSYVISVQYKISEVIGTGFIMIQSVCPILLHSDSTRNGVFWENMTCGLVMLKDVSKGEVFYSEGGGTYLRNVCKHLNRVRHIHQTHR